MEIELKCCSPKFLSNASYKICEVVFAKMVRYDSIFDVLGHIMVGPSSSHTAGACRIGYISHIIFGGVPQSAQIFLHGSFAETYRGHKTDVAIVAGLLGISPDDERIKHSFEIARDQNMRFIIQSADLGPEYHPNSVLLRLHSSNSLGKDKSLELIGSSIGGGNIKIIEINGLEAGFNGDSPTIIINHFDKSGIIAKITKCIAEANLNIKQMHSSRNIRKKLGLTWIVISGKIEQSLITNLNALKNVNEVSWLNV